MTAAGREALEAELAELENVRRPEIVARIASTRSEGDLSENAGYHQAREDQSHVEGRVLEICAALREALTIESRAPDGAAPMRPPVPADHKSATTPSSTS